MNAITIDNGDPDKRPIRQTEIILDRKPILNDHVRLKDDFYRSEIYEIRGKSFLYGYTMHPLNGGSHFFTRRSKFDIIESVEQRQNKDGKWESIIK